MPAETRRTFNRHLPPPRKPAKLRREMVPHLDLAVLRLVGEADPEVAPAHMLREARTAPRSLLRTMTVAQMVIDASGAGLLM